MYCADRLSGLAMNDSKARIMRRIYLSVIGPACRSIFVDVTASRDWPRFLVHQQTFHRCPKTNRDTPGLTRRLSPGPFPLPHSCADRLHRFFPSEIDLLPMRIQHEKVISAHVHALSPKKGSIGRKWRPDSEDAPDLNDELFHIPRALRCGDF
jgi:hypothetical protein